MSQRTVQSLCLLLVLAALGGRASGWLRLSLRCVGLDQGELTELHLVQGFLFAEL